MFHFFRLPSFAAFFVTGGLWAFQPAASPESPATAADLAKTIQQSGMDAAECYRIRDLNFVSNDVKFYFNDGYLIFSNPVLGHRLTAVFTTDVEGGDGEVIIIPPSRSERQSLAEFTKSPNLDEHVRAVLMIFTDGSMARLREALEDQQVSAKKAPEMGALLAQRWDSVAANILGPMQMRLVTDLWSGRSSETGMAFFAISGNTLGNFDILADARADHRVVVRQSTEREGRQTFNVWTEFFPRVFSAKNTPQTPGRPKPEAARVPSEREFTLSHYRIDAEIGNDLAVKATTHVSVHTGANPVRVFPFEISRAMDVKTVRIDGAPAELMRDDSPRGRIRRGVEEVEFLAVASTALAPGSVHEFEFEQQGEVIVTRGDGVYFVSARGSWYPHVAGQFATYDLAFRYPKRLTLVAAGDPLEDRSEGDWRITRRRLPIPVGAAGFNLGLYDKVTGAAAGVKFEVYGNRNLDPSMRPLGTLPDPLSTPPQPPFRTRSLRMPQPLSSIPVPPDPAGRLRVVADDVAASLEFFSGMFGPPLMKTLTVAPIPATFGQGFPGLVYLSTFSYIDPVSRPVALRNAREQVVYSDLMLPHEVAHQWWGGVIATRRTEDEWLLEALANYSSLLWLEKKKGIKEVQTVLDGYRRELLDKDAEGAVYESVGPIAWGERLDGHPTTGAWRVITYDKGTWILHMLRRRLGDESFFNLLAELRRRYESKSITTEDFQALTRELRPKNLRPEVIDAFFDNWVYATGMPALKLRYKVTGAAPAVKISGIVEQSGAGEDFSIDAPVELQFAKGPSQTIWVRTTGEENSFSAILRQVPVRVQIAEDFLAKK